MEPMNRSTGEVLVNARFAGRRVTGVERFAGEVVRCLDGSARLIRPPRLLRGWAGQVWEQLVLPLRVPPGAPLWSPANTGPLAVREQAVSIHDLSPLDHPEWFAPAFALWYRLLLPALARRARRVIVPSAFTARSLRRRFNLAEEKLVLAPGSVDPARFHPVDPQPVRRRYNLPRRYLLFVGSLQPRKNLSGLLAALETLQQRFPEVELVAAGAESPHFRRDGLDAGKTRVRFLGYVPDEVLPALYSGAEAFVLPSWYEGFGLPVLEAMACGCPVAASCAGSLPEVVGEAGLLFDPAVREDIERRLAALLADAGLRQELRQRGLERAGLFSWERSAGLIDDAIRGLR